MSRGDAEIAMTRSQVSEQRRRAVASAWSMLVGAIAVALGGCFLVGAPERPDRGSVSGPVPYVEDCQACHAAPVGAHYLQSLHASMGVRCGQCHTPGGHPDFRQPVRDAKCGGCHLPEYQQTIGSRHYARRDQRPLDGDRAARARLRRDGFMANTAQGRVFVGDASSGDLGGRLCAACHYDEHRLGRDAVQRADFCTGCHTNRTEHFPSPTDGNRCVQCHVRVGQTVKDQNINTHRFAKPGD
jgi:Cytochrome c7 and related cytochrome c